MRAAGVPGKGNRSMVGMILKMRHETETESEKECLCTSPEQLQLPTNWLIELGHCYACVRAVEGCRDEARFQETVGWEGAELVLLLPPCFLVKGTQKGWLKVWAESLMSSSLQAYSMPNYTMQQCSCPTTGNMRNIEDKKEQQNTRACKILLA